MNDQELKQKAAKVRNCAYIAAPYEVAQDIDQVIEALLARIRHLEAQLQEMQEREAELRDILSCMVYEDDPCEYDHHGYCQAHCWLQEGECPDKRAKRALGQEDV